jgi:hypothetical protein
MQQNIQQPQTEEKSRRVALQQQPAREHAADFQI